MKSNCQIVGVEANYNLHEFASRMIKLNGIRNYVINNHILYSDNSPVSFEINTDNNTVGKINKKSYNATTLIKYESGSTFNDILKKYSIDSDFILISDIEGAEAFFIFHEANLNHCKMILIELHEFENYSVAMMVTKLVEKGFKMIDRYGFCFVFEKNSI